MILDFLQAQFELLGGANEFYIAESTGSDINVSKYDGSSGARIGKEIDVMASGYEDVIGGMTLNDNETISGSRMMIGMDYFAS